MVLPHITLVFPFDSELTNDELNLHIKMCLSNIQPFRIELKGFSKQENKHGNYLFLNIVQGVTIIRNIHDRLYTGKLMQFAIGYDYNPHMTVGKVPSVDLLNKAFDDVNRCNCKFVTLIKKVSVEMIGKHEESIIIMKHELG